MVDVFAYLAAGAPFVVAALALVGLRWPATRSGLAALSAALAAAFLWPGLEPGGLPGAFADGLGTASRVLYILFGGLLLYNLLSAGGAVEELSRFLGRLAPDSAAVALLVVLGVGPFFESVTGFGVAVVISAPILLGAGFSALRSAVLATWGQCAVPWGALGVGTVIGADLADLTFGRLSDWSALLNLPLFPVYGLAAVTLASGIGGLRRRGYEAIFLGLLAGAGTLATSLLFIPELSGAIGGLSATGGFLALRRRRFAGLRLPVRGLAPYGVLLGLITLASGLEPVQKAIQTLGPAFTGPGLPLLVSGAFAAWLLGLGARRSGAALRSTGVQWLPTAGAVVTFILAGEVVAASGAADILASGAAASGAGGWYAAASAAVGGLGGILTGSNAASNALFMPFQVEAARALGVREVLVAAIQNVAGSHASMLAPQRLILAATATGLLGSEGNIARKALPPVAMSLAILAFLGLLVAG